MSDKKMYDTKITYIEDDLKKIQVKTNMYLQQYGPAGIAHMFREVAQNSIDEYSDPMLDKYLRSLKEKTNKKIIRVEYNQADDLVTVEDDGRGIPEDSHEIDVVCTKLQSGSKFFRDQGGSSSGEFGVGLTVVNALSRYFSISTYRGDYFHTIVFENGEKKLDVKNDIAYGMKKHGTIISFSANQEYLGAGATLPIDSCIEWMELMSYQISNNIEFDVTIIKEDGAKEKKVIKKKPFSELIYKFVNTDHITMKPLSFENHGQITEDIKKQEIVNGKIKEKIEHQHKDVALEFAFTYDESQLENTYTSFCNFTKTDEGGIHVDAVEDAICRFLKKEASATQTEQQKSKYPITALDVKSGLQLVVNLSTNAQVQFMGNAKNKIQNEALKPLLRELATDALIQTLGSDSAKLDKVCKIVKASAKARVDLQKLKSTIITAKVDRFSELGIPNFVPANRKSAKGYREIYCIEGQRSAAGSIVDGRDPMSQAVFGFRGQTLNVFNTTLDKVMENVEWKNYVRCLHTGIGPKFDISKLYYDKIVIATDADIDGYLIGTGIAAFHLVHMTPLVKEGHLYKVYPPLYRINDKEHPFVIRKTEITDKYLKNILKEYSARFGGKGYMSDDDFWNFLNDTSNYTKLLSDLAKFYKVPRGLIEIAAASIALFNGLDVVDDKYMLKDGIFTDQKFVRDMMQFIQMKYDEIKLHGNVLVGVAEGRDVSIQISNRFVKRLDEAFSIFLNYGYYIYARRKNDIEQKMSIGEFLDSTAKLKPQIEARFKGLGESNPEELWDTTLNPATRHLVRLTITDIERDMEIFNKLKSGKSIYRKQRKEMMESFRLPKEDLDN